ncbi:MAG TPA: DUF1552 domain-containing protein [Kofleriaceae bacterium]|jgi:hypothetical protein|nr:DUF1552 domain-containing protein [Kofleriaceae bacterium]
MSRITRRRLLGGSLLAMGSSLVAPLVRTLWAHAPTPQPRVVIVIEGNSFYTRSVLSPLAQAQINAMTGRPLTTEMITDDHYEHTSVLEIPNSGLASAASLGPLATHGVDTKAAVVLGLSCAIAGGGHSSYQGGFACARGNQAQAPAITIDAVLASRLHGDTPFDALRIGVGGVNQRLSYSTCAFDRGRPAPISTSPIDAYNRLFATIAGGTTDPRVQKRATALDYARSDVTAALAAFSGSSRERAKLEAYLTAVEQSQARQARLLALAGTVTPPPGPTGVAGDPYAEPDALTRLEVQFDLAAAALIGGLTNVMVVASGPGGGLDLNYRSVFETIPNWPAIQMDMDRHTLQHGIQIPIHQEAILAVTRKQIDLIGRFAAKLDAVPEGSGTMLDHTIIVFISDNGEQHHSQSREWPVLLLGGSALGLKTDGRTVVYPRIGKANNRQVSNLWNTLGHATGDDTLNEFGQEGSGRIAKGPLDEIYG